ncbi:MAG: hypothetical protein IPO94_11765 [Saprospiraceae bacterium]|nr:hypothetical protein [Saprospiraceae bacterium]
MKIRRIINAKISGDYKTHHMKAYNNLHKVNIEKMNLPKKLIFIAVCTLWATTTFGQNFNRIYFEGKERNTFI